MIIKIHKRLAKRMQWYDISLLKLAVLAFTLFLLTAWPEFAALALSVDWYWYLAVVIASGIPLWKKAMLE